MLSKLGWWGSAVDSEPHGSAVADRRGEPDADGSMRLTRRQSTGRGRIAATGVKLFLAPENPQPDRRRRAKPWPHRVLTGQGGSSTTTGRRARSPDRTPWQAPVGDTAGRHISGTSVARTSARSSGADQGKIIEAPGSTW
jgi:hypothetical protein